MTWNCLGDTAYFEVLSNHGHRVQALNRFVQVTDAFVGLTWVSLACLLKASTNMFRRMKVSSVVSASGMVLPRTYTLRIFTYRPRSRSSSTTQDEYPISHKSTRLLPGDFCANSSAINRTLTLRIACILPSALSPTVCWTLCFSISSLFRRLDRQHSTHWAKQRRLTASVQRPCTQ